MVWYNMIYKTFFMQRIAPTFRAQPFTRLDKYNGERVWLYAKGITKRIGDVAKDLSMM